MTPPPKKPAIQHRHSRSSTNSINNASGNDGGESDGNSHSFKKKWKKRLNPLSLIQQPLKTLRNNCKPGNFSSISLPMDLSSPPPPAQSDDTFKMEISSSTPPPASSPSTRNNNSNRQFHLSPVFSNIPLAHANTIDVSTLSRKKKFSLSNLFLPSNTPAQQSSTTTKQKGFKHIPLERFKTIEPKDGATKHSSDYRLTSRHQVQSKILVHSFKRDLQQSTMIHHDSMDMQSNNINSVDNIHQNITIPAAGKEGKYEEVSNQEYKNQEEEMDDMEMQDDPNGKYDSDNQEDDDEEEEEDDGMEAVNVSKNYSTAPASTSIISQFKNLHPEIYNSSSSSQGNNGNLTSQTLNRFSEPHPHGIHLGSNSTSTCPAIPVESTSPTLLHELFAPRKSHETTAENR